MKRCTAALLAFFAIILGSNSASASAVIRVAAGTSPAAIQSAFDQFRADLGGPNNGIGGSFTNGHREVTWEGTHLDNVDEPNAFPYDFYNTNSPRGLIFHSIANIGGNHQFRVSARSGSGTAVEFANIDPTYSSVFQPFSGERIFHARFSNEIEILFFIPGTTIPATVSGFGAVFCDVDSSNTFIEYYATDGSKISGSSLNTANDVACPARSAMARR